MPEVEARRRGRYVVYSVVVTLFVLGIGHEVGEMVVRGIGVPLRVEDVAVFVVEPLLDEADGALRTTPYAEVNSVRGSLALRKGSGWRAVALGGSFMFGDPYGERGEPPKPGGIPFWIDQRLQGADRPVEILSQAGMGDTSIRVREKAARLLRHDLDVLIVATGNNEYPLEPPRRRVLLRRCELIRFFAGPTDDDRPWAPGELEELHRNSPPYPILRAQYRSNLEEIARLAEERDVPVLLATLPNNLLHTIVGPGGEGWSEGCSRSVAGAMADRESRTGRWGEGIARIAAGDTEAGRTMLEPVADPCVAQALERYRDGRFDEALELAQGCDGVAALPHAAVGLVATGRREAGLLAAELWLESQPWGLRPSFNHVVREVAAAHDHVHLVDLQAAALEGAGQALPGPDQFVDSCHMHWSGYARMAEVFVQALTDAGLAPGPVAPAGSPGELAARFGLDAPLAPLPALQPGGGDWSCPAEVPAP